MLKRYLLENWIELIGSPIPDSLDLLPISSCKDEYGNIVILLFTSKKKYPSYVMKVCRNTEHGVKIRREFNSLKLLKSRPELCAFIPTPYSFIDNCGHVFFIQDGIAGLSLLNIIRKHGIDNSTSSLLEQAVDLLIDINKSIIGVDGHAERMMMNLNTKDMLDYTEEEFINAEISLDKLGDVREFIDLISGKAANLYLHGDYWQTNIIADYRENKISGIIDWEFSRAGALYPKDIMWFIINLGYCLYLIRNPSGTINAAYRWTFFTKGKHAELITSYYQRYIEAMKWDTGQFVILLKLTLLEMSMREKTAYGKHFKMDYIWRDVLKYTIENENRLCIF